jgi:hypothetical protein
MGRLCIYNKDIQIITGKSERTCRKIMEQIRKLHNKQKHQPLTIEEFCNYLDLNKEDVKKIIK